MEAKKGDFGGKEFWLVGELHLRRTATGQIEEYSHQINAGIRTNLHAAGPFCYFSLPQAPHASGVYAIVVDRDLKYIGECEDLNSRFSSKGYGRISPRNCHHDGQSTNCKLNSRVLKVAKLSKVTNIWFHPTSNYKKVESELISQLTPPWNGREIFTNKEVRRMPPVRVARTRVKAQPHGSATAEDFRTTILAFFDDAERRGARTLVLQAGVVHRKVGGYPGNHRMPTCCAVLRRFMQDGDRFIYQPPKGDGAKLEIEFKLPRWITS